MRRERNIDHDRRLAKPVIAVTIEGVRIRLRLAVELAWAYVDWLMGASSLVIHCLSN